MKKIVLSASKRMTGNKSRINQARKSGRVPGVFYSAHHKPISIEVAENTINPLVFTAKTHLIGLELEGKEESECILKDVQFDPVTDRVIHFDLIGLTKGETIEVEVPVKIIGSAVGIKDGGILQQVLHKVQVECLPKDIPDHIEVEVTNLKIGASIHIKDLQMEAIKFTNLPDSVIISVTHPKVEKEPVAGETAEITEPEVIGKGKPSEEEEKEK